MHPHPSSSGYTTACPKFGYPTIWSSKSDRNAARPDSLRHREAADGHLEAESGRDYKYVYMYTCAVRSVHARGLRKPAYPASNPREVASHHHKIAQVGSLREGIVYISVAAPVKYRCIQLLISHRAPFSKHPLLQIYVHMSGHARYTSVR